jgi:DNA-binding NarL/FixJ family response regulator
MSSRVARCTVVLAEDHADMAEELRSLLQLDFDVVAWVTDGSALVEAVRQLTPDCVVADVSMPIKDGLAAAAELIRERPGLPMVFVSVHRDAALVAKALALGICGYVLKRDAAEELVSAVRAVLGGTRYTSRALF